MLGAAPGAASCGGQRSQDPKAIFVSPWHNTTGRPRSPLTLTRKRVYCKSTAWGCRVASTLLSCARSQRLPAPRQARDHHSIVRFLAACTHGNSNLQAQRPQAAFPGRPCESSQDTRGTSPEGFCTRTHRKSETGREFSDLVGVVASLQRYSFRTGAFACARPSPGPSPRWAA